MQNAPKSPKRYKVLAIVEALLIFVLIFALAWALFIKPQDAGTAVPASTSAQVDEEDDSEDPEVRTRAVIEKEETYYQLNGKKMLLNDGTYGQVYIPVLEDVPACELDMQNMVTRNGYSFYKENGEITSITGIDVSEHQGSIDWEQVKNAGIGFVFIRAGYRTYGGGEIKIDERLKENLEGATKAGLDVGVYFFSQATNSDEAIEEADAVLDQIKGYKLTYPVVFDWELIYGDNARTDSVTVEALADCCVAFCERVKSAGYKPMVYQNKLTSVYKLDVSRIKDYDFWLAEYGTEPTYYYDYKIWQYSSNGIVPGITGEVDLNLSFKDYAAE